MKQADTHKSKLIAKIPNEISEYVENECVIVCPECKDIDVSISNGIAVCGNCQHCWVLVK